MRKVIYKYAVVTTKPDETAPPTAERFFPFCYVCSTVRPFSSLLSFLPSCIYNPGVSVKSYRANILVRGRVRSVDT